ncbi:MAG: glycine--tRNA ligase subunit beta [Pikeienuella sp.]|uniref:glycine--tRNA ligase subunit beta n=1 Tax=Pikeienuella sp. TaxID=2831957 RepID=UPI00391CA732
MADLLLELFSEEIPARMQARAAEDLKRLFTEAMVARGLTYAAAAAFATPRRLALSVTGLPKATMPVREERKGPRTDAPEAALEGFLRSTGLTRDRLEKRADKKGEVWFAVIEAPGRPAAEVIAEIAPEVIRAFPWPRSMRWGSGDLTWVRPLRSILCILSDEAGTDVVPFGIGGVASGGETEGHRFMAPARFAPRDFDDYAKRLLAAKVVLDPEERRARIRADMANLAFAAGMEVVEDEGLLAEVAGLVEWPVALMGEIEERFLGLPPEVLRTSMKEHQKFFSLRNPKTGRIERFVTVANIEAPDGGATILKGNLRVLAARLSDALFFWENDLRTVERGGMEALGAKLENVTFHSKLGTQADRVKRIAALAREIAPMVGADPETAAQAAMVCKADLTSEMVGEFPELQGVMGEYYAKAAGLAGDVAAAAREHYAPLGPSDAVPTAPVSVAVALADKIDMLAGFWAIEEKPTGSKDPFALRRAALGVVLILTKSQLRLPLVPCFHRAHFDFVRGRVARQLIEKNEALDRAEQTSGANRELVRESLSEARRTAVAEVSDMVVFSGEPGRSDVVTAYPENIDLLAFFADRLKVHLRGEGVRHDVIDACFRLGGQDDLVLLVARVRALQAFLATEEGANLLAGYKRASNIVAAEAKKDGAATEGAPDPALAREPEEQALFTALDAAEAAIGPALEREDFAAAMEAMAGLRAPIDAFFEKVIVNAPEPETRLNRLRLLGRIREVMRRVAIFSAIEG